MLKKFKHIYYINLERRPDRWERTQKELKKFKLDKRVVRFPTVDGKKLPKRGDLLSGELGLIQTHIQLLNHAIQMTHPNILIFEDDIEFLYNFKDVDEYISEVPKDWDIIYLGGNNIEQPIRITSKIGRVVNTLTSHGLIINQRIYRDLLVLLHQHKHPIDVLYSDIQDKKVEYERTYQ